MTELGFEGRVRATAAESTPWWPSASQGSSDAPNIVLIVLDDTGWADLGCFGSEINTPHIDSLATNGQRFNNFHVTPLCSPTRASLLTGRNHHGVGMRFLADADTGFPNSRGHVRRDVPMLPQILRDAGYGTYLLGKWHLTPLHEITPAGPTHNWPLARGFDRFYGFLDGCTDQYDPELYQDNHPVHPPQRDDYHLTEDLVDRAVTYLRDHVTFRSDSPLFMQFAPGATHAPLQAPREYVDRYVDVFAKGWDQTREHRLSRQISLGVAPAGTRLTERDPAVPVWADLDHQERELYTHLQAAFAGYLEHTDAQVGRLLAELEHLGLAENTITVVTSDNGASREGGPNGDVDTNAPYSGVTRPAAEQRQHLEDIGTSMGPAHYPEGWAMAGNTPFRRYKQYLDLGGVRSPLIVSWPRHTRAPGRVVQTFAHAVDLSPTLLDLAGLDPLDGIDGTSIATAVTHAVTPSGRDEQAFEMLGHRALWSDGWVAVTEHMTGTDYAEERWRLYDADTDFAHTTDVADLYPDKVSRLQHRWWQLAHEHDILPLDDRTLVQLLRERNPRGLVNQDTIVLRPGQGRLPFASAVTGSDRGMFTTAFLADYRAGDDGVLVASGNQRSGYSLYVLDGRLCFEHHFLDARTRLDASTRLPEAVRSVGFHLGRHDHTTTSADVSLFVEGRPVAQTRIPRTSGHLSFYGLEVGHDPISPVSDRYASPFPFCPRTLDRVELHFTEETDLTKLARMRLVAE